MEKHCISNHRVHQRRVHKCRIHNRILAIMAHTTRYAFKGESRLAADAGVSKSAVSRLINGQSSPSFALVCGLTRALEKQLGKHLDPRELLSFDGTYPTPSVCQLAGCKGCLPSAAYDEEGRLRPQFKDVKPGEWSLSPALAAASPAVDSPPVAAPDNQYPKQHHSEHPQEQQEHSAKEAP